MKHLHTLAVISVFSFTSPAAAEPPAIPAPSSEDLKREDWIKAGEGRFIKTCAYCHGTKGEAGKTAAFSTRENWDPQIIFDTISEGRTNGSNVMPSWKGSIPDDEIWKIVAYIKSLAAANAK